MGDTNYWLSNRVSRRSALRTAGLVGSGLAGAALIGCGSDEDGGSSSGTVTAAGTSNSASSTVTAVPTAAEGTAAHGGTFVAVQVNTDVTDIHQSAHPGTQAWANLAMDGLIQQLEPTPGDLELAPMIAESWEQVDDLTLVFKLRQDVKFANIAPLNGRQLVAEDVKYSFERQTTDDPRFTQGALLSAIQTVEAVDDNTVKVTSAAPAPSLLSRIASPWSLIIAREQVDQDGDTVKVPMGSGPFIIDRLDVGNEITTRPNPDYWMKDRPYLDGYTNLSVDDAAQAAAFRAGEIDYASAIPVEQAADFQTENPEAKLMRSHSRGVGIVAFNNRVAPYDDIRVRQAIGWASDIQGWVDVLLGGEGDLAGPMPPSFKPWALSEDELVFRQRDVQKAKDLLAAAGYGDGFTMDAFSIATNPSYIGQAVQMKEDVRELGIDVQIEGITSGDYTTRLFANADFVVATGEDFAADDPDALMQRFYSAERLNYVGYNNTRVDELFEKQKITVEYEERRALVDEIQTIMLEEVPTLFTFQRFIHRWVSGRMQDFRVSAITGNSERWVARNTWIKE